MYFLIKIRAIAYSRIQMTKQTVAILSVISGNVKFASDRYLQEQNLYRYENGVSVTSFFIL